jgi:hypothetical protein
LAAVRSEDAKKIHLLAFDPGGTTGWFQATFDPETGQIDPGTARYGEVSGRHHGSLDNMLNLNLLNNPNLMIVTEDYIPEFAQAQNVVALEYIGVMEAFAQTKAVSFERQSRNIKKFWTREKMMAVGVWPRGKTHAQDAARHWLAYAAKQSRPLHMNLARSLREADE